MEGRALGCRESVTDVGITKEGRLWPLWGWGASPGIYSRTLATGKLL